MHVTLSLSVLLYPMSLPIISRSQHVSTARLQNFFCQLCYVKVHETGIFASCDVNRNAAELASRQWAYWFRPLSLVSVGISMWSISISEHPAEDALSQCVPHSKSHSGY